MTNVRLISELSSPVPEDALLHGIGWLKRQGVLRGAEGCWVAGAHRIYRVSSDLLPVEGGWRWFVRCEGEPVALIDLRGEGSAAQAVGAVGGRYPAQLAGAITAVEAMPAVSDMVLRVIRFPTCTAELLWLHSPAGGGDWLAPTRSHAGLRPLSLHPYSDLPHLARAAFRRNAG
ncbi:MAG TPA: hypothetical protein VIG99_30465 [Myxococcaceae bacterium]